MLSRKTRMVISIIIAAIAITSTVTYLDLAGTNGTPATEKLPGIELGPKLAIHVFNFSANQSVRNNTVISVQIFGLFPQDVSGSRALYYNLTGANRSNNHDYVELLNTTMGSENVTEFLSPVFLNVAYAWSSHMYPGDRPSLTIEATKTVSINGTAEVYTYYNNIPYDPTAVVVDSFNGTGLNEKVSADWFSNTSLNVSDYRYINYTALAFHTGLTFPGNPAWKVKLPSPITPAARMPAKVESGSTSGTYYYWTTYSTTYYNETGTSSQAGYLPLNAVHMSNGTADGLSAIVLSASIKLESTTIGINSNQVSWTNSGSVTSALSAFPAYSHVANSTYEAPENQYFATPLNFSLFKENNSLPDAENGTTAFVGIEGAVYTFIHYKVYVATQEDEWEVTWHLVPWTYDGKTYYRNVSSTTLVKSGPASYVNTANASAGEISSIQNITDLQVHAGLVPPNANKLIQALAERNPSENLSLTPSGPGYSLSGDSIYTTDSAYTNANQVIKDANAAMTVFSVGLIEGLAITDTLAAANGADFDAEEGAIVDLTIGLVSAELALESAVLSYFNTIGFVATSTSSTIAYGITNEPLTQPGTAYRFVYYQGENPATISFNGNTFSFLAPMDYLNFTADVGVSVATNNLNIITPENTTQSSTPGINETGGVWYVDPGDSSVEIANYYIPANAQYMAGNIFNEWQDFAFQPGLTENYEGTEYYTAGNVLVNLINSQGGVVATWYHDFESEVSTSNYNFANDWVYINPTFSIVPVPNSTDSEIPEPIVEIQFVNNVRADFGSTTHFLNVSKGGLISFAEAQGNDNSIGNPLPEHWDEPGIAWHGYTPNHPGATWNIPSNTTSYMIIWSSPYVIAITYDGGTEYGYNGIFYGTSASTISAYTTYYVYGTGILSISEVFELK